MHFDPEEELIPQGGWNPDLMELISVGIDIGSSTSHLMFSRLFLERRGRELSSRFEVVDREILFRSPVLLTPYRDGDTIDTEAQAGFVEGRDSSAYTWKRCHSSLSAELPRPDTEREEELLHTLANWRNEILNYFDYRITLGFVEGKNNRIKTIKRMAYGYRNMANFRLRILATNSRGTATVLHTY